VALTHLDQVEQDGGARLESFVNMVVGSSLRLKGGGFLNVFH
jgi:hypothetical protein